MTDLIIPPGAENDPFWSLANMARLRESFQQVEEGKVITLTLEELLAMEEELDDNAASAPETTR